LTTFDYLLSAQVTIVALVMPLALVRWLSFASKKAWAKRRSVGALGDAILPIQILS